MREQSPDRLRWIVVVGLDVLPRLTVDPATVLAGKDGCTELGHRFLIGVLSSFKRGEAIVCRVQELVEERALILGEQGDPFLVGVVTPPDAERFPGDRLVVNRDSPLLGHLGKRG